MHLKHLPEQILFKPDVLWNVSGLFAKDKLLLDFMNLMKDGFGQEKVFASVHGSPPLRWNSGRSTAPLNKAKINEIIDVYTKKNIPLYLTFSNPLIKTKDLGESSCNYVLDKIAETKMGGIILTSKVLFNYIKDKYPHLKMVSSALRSVFHKGPCNVAFYEDLAKTFDRVVVHPDDSINFSLLQKLSDKDKFEILINENCQYKCEGRQVEHSMIALSCYRGNFRDIIMDVRSDENTRLKCNSGPMKKQINFQMSGSNPNRIRNLNFSYPDLNLLYDLGFRNFKLQGRLDGYGSFIQDLTRYVLEPNFIYPMVFKYLSKLYSNKKGGIPPLQQKPYIGRKSRAAKEKKEALR